MRAIIIATLLALALSSCDTDPSTTPGTNTDAPPSSYALQDIGDCQLLEPATGKTVPDPQCNK
ncbi:MAG: hypothetical protein GY753_17015 [Gammaproteobacteria bacterium]|nr:hypothetical protein [Gammaproteobacteria bacterium]